MKEPIEKDSDEILRKVATKINKEPNMPNKKPGNEKLTDHFLEPQIMGQKLIDNDQNVEAKVKSIIDQYEQPFTLFQTKFENRKKLKSGEIYKRDKFDIMKDKRFEKFAKIGEDLEGTKKFMQMKERIFKENVNKFKGFKNVVASNKGIQNIFSGVGLPGTGTTKYYIEENSESQQTPLISEIFNREDGQILSEKISSTLQINNKIAIMKSKTSGIVRPNIILDTGQNSENRLVSRSEPKRDLELANSNEHVDISEHFQNPEIEVEKSHGNCVIRTENKHEYDRASTSTDSKMRLASDTTVYDNSIFRRGWPDAKFIKRMLQCRVSGEPEVQSVQVQSVDSNTSNAPVNANSTSLFQADIADPYTNKTTPISPNTLAKFDAKLEFERRFAKKTRRRSPINAPIIVAPTTSNSTNLNLSKFQKSKFLLQ